jgi:hypothetical protein
MGAEDSPTRLRRRDMAAHPRGVAVTGGEPELAPHHVVGAVTNGDHLNGGREWVCVLGAPVKREMGRS